MHDCLAPRTTNNVISELRATTMGFDAFLSGELEQPVRVTRDDNPIDLSDALELTDLVDKERLPPERREILVADASTLLSCWDD
jgi:hypothetical protein